MKGLFKTDKGQIRKLNEDYGGVHLNEADQYLTIIADGMGGHKAGEVASQLTHKVFSEAWLIESDIKTAKESEQWLKENIIKANQKIIDYARNDEACQGMGTTVVAAICTNEFITIAHVGDSRGYLLNESGFNQLTDDHSLVNELMKSGEISENEAITHPQKNVLLKALGTKQDINPEIKTIPWEEENRLLLCSDGLSNKINNSELSNIVKKVNTEEEIEEKLIKLANDRGGEDNITVSLIIKESSSKVGDY